MNQIPPFRAIPTAQHRETLLTVTFTGNMLIRRHRCMREVLKLSLLRRVTPLAYELGSRGDREVDPTQA